MPFGYLFFHLFTPYPLLLTPYSLLGRQNTEVALAAVLKTATKNLRQAADSAPVQAITNPS